MSNQTMPLSTAVKYFQLARRGEVTAATSDWCEDMLAPLLSAFAAVPVDQLTVNDLRLYRLELRKRYSVTTVNSQFRVLKQLYAWLIDEGFVEHSPAERIKPLKKEKAEDGNDGQVKGISQDGFTLLLEHIKRGRKLRDVAMIMLLYCTGVRVSGLVTMKLSKVDWERGRVWIVNKGRGKPYWGYFDEEGQTASAIRDYLDYDRPRTDSAYLFPGSGKTGHMTRAAVHQILKRYAKACGLTDPANPHAFRHGFSIAMLLDGANLAVVSQLLGHSNIKTTADKYAVFQTDGLQEAHGRHNPLVQIGGQLDEDELLAAFFKKTG